ncbi:MAG TPA: Hsp33 family molecular chaperone HslO [Steroidobacteraceae bacterium]|nr:Hsp33 family molecular chaperone HslO [Steroidobacteraceae bacterium]
MADSSRSQGGVLRRFMLEHHPVRGFWIRLDAAWREVLRYQSYPRAVEVLLGEAVSATLLLAATLKFQGTLTLQLTGDGLVRLLVAQCTHDFDVRAVARVDGEVAEGAGFHQLVGAGRLTVTIESDESGTRYQGIVALQGDSLARCLEDYFATSEQLPTQLALIADSERSVGVLLQKMPAAGSRGEAIAAVSQDVWDCAYERLQTLEPQVLRDASAEDVLQELCAEEDCRLFAPSPVRFACRCSAARVGDVLRALGSEEIDSILAEQGAVTVTCDFCGKPYHYDAIDIERLFSQGASPEIPPTLN